MKPSAKLPESTSNLPVEQLSYEEAILELEGIVSTLEDGQINLDAALLLFQRGNELAVYCRDLLNQAALKVKLISGDDFSPPSLISE